MKAEYRRDLQHSYLVLRVEDKADEQAYSLKMITQNHIQGLLECECRRMDEEVLYYYDLNSKISLAEKCCVQKVTGQEILRIVYSLLQLLGNMEEYLLSGESLCLKAEYIYMDTRMQEVDFCYVPGERWEFQEQFRDLMEGLLPFLDHQNQDEAMAVYGLYHYAVQEEFAVDGLRRLLENYRREEKQETAEEEDETETVREGILETQMRSKERKEHEEALEAFFQDDEEEEKRRVPLRVTLGSAGVLVYLLCCWFLWRNFPDKLWIWFGCGTLVSIVFVFFYKRRRDERQEEEEEDDGEEEKMIQKREPLEAGELVRKREMQENSRKLHRQNTAEEGEAAWKWDSSEEREIKEEEECVTRILKREERRVRYVLEERYPQPGRQVVFGEGEIQFIGYQKGKADLLLPSQTVSRLHARLRRNGDTCYLCDLNSRNGTWVNGQEVRGEQEVELRPGDEIRFADMVYCLRQR